MRIALTPNDGAPMDHTAIPRLDRLVGDASAAIQYEVISQAVTVAIETLQQPQLSSAYTNIFQQVLDTCEDIRIANDFEWCHVEYFMTLLKRNLPAWKWDRATSGEKAQFTTEMAPHTIIAALVESMKFAWNLSDETWRRDTKQQDTQAPAVIRVANNSSLSKPELRRGDTYFAIDTEADGPRVGVGIGDHSLLSIGVVAFDHQGTELSAFSANLLPLSGQVADPETMKNFWGAHGNAAAYKATRVDRKNPHVAFYNLKAWIRETHSANATSMGCLPSERMSIALMWPSAADYPRVHAYWSSMNTTLDDAAMKRA